MNTTLTHSQKQYMEAHKAYGKEVEKLLIVAPDTKTDLEIIIDAVKTSWSNLKELENALFSAENDRAADRAITII